MASASLAVQKAIGARLVATSGVTALVAAADIADRGGRPVSFPCISIGDAMEIDEGLDLARTHVRVYATLHLWAREPGLAGVKAIGAAVKAALKAKFAPLDGIRFLDVRTETIRYMRDPGGELSHGVFDVEALVQETS